MSGDDVLIVTGTTTTTVHLPTILPTSGTYTIRTGQPVTIAPGCQQIEITISLVTDDPKPEPADGHP